MLFADQLEDSMASKSGYRPWLAVVAENADNSCVVRMGINHPVVLAGLWQLRHVETLARRLALLTNGKSNGKNFISLPYKPYYSRADKLIWHILAISQGLLGLRY